MSTRVALRAQTQRVATPEEIRRCLLNLQLWYETAAARRRLGVREPKRPVGSLHR